MSPIQPALDRLCADIEAMSRAMGRAVRPQALGVLDRTGHLALGDPGQRVSPNGACRLLRAADGWIALNLARPEDRDLVPAWVQADGPLAPDEDAVWTLAERGAVRWSCADLVAQASLLGLPASRVGEAAATHTPPSRPTVMAHRQPWRVVDLSALWAGPLCGAILAEMGAEVVRIESRRRPDPTRETTPDFFRALNGGKSTLELDLVCPLDQTRLRAAILAADVLITSVRPRGLASLGLEHEALLSENPRLTWVAITGHGWGGEAGQRVGFGDDTAAAGGLVRWTGEGPVFLGDALADPVAGLEAALAALSVGRAGGGFVEVAMAGAAASAAVACRLRSTA